MLFNRVSFPCCVRATSRVPKFLVHSGGTQRCRRLVFALAIVSALGWVTVPEPVFGETIESFEGPDPSWVMSESDCRASIIAQQRRLKGAHSGQGCEYLRVAMAQGTRVYLTHEIPPSSVIAEWQPSVWVKSDRPGIQLLVRVVLPRTIDKRSGEPMTTLLGGAAYQDVGAWQRLTLTEPLVLLERQMRVLRSQLDQPIDARQAYVDLVVLNAHGGAVETNLWVDDLEVKGLVLARAVVATELDRASVAPGESAVVAASASWPVERAMEGQVVGDVERPARRHAETRVQGSSLIVGQRPLVVRAARWRGEPFDWLKELGFNTILLPQAPTPQ